MSLERIATHSWLYRADLANLLNRRRCLTAERRFITLLEVDNAVDRVVAGMEGTPLVDSRRTSD